MTGTDLLHVSIDPFIYPEVDTQLITREPHLLVSHAFCMMHQSLQPAWKLMRFLVHLSRHGQGYMLGRGKGIPLLVEALIKALLHAVVVGGHGSQPHTKAGGQAKGPQI